MSNVRAPRFGEGYTSTFASAACVAIGEPPLSLASLTPSLARAVRPCGWSANCTFGLSAVHGGTRFAARCCPTIISIMSALPPLPDTPLGRYRHYKGGEYEVIGVARHSETLEPLVVYRPLYTDSGWWVRPHAMFFEQVEVNARLQPRFAFAGPEA